MKTSRLIAFIVVVLISFHVAAGCLYAAQSFDESSTISDSNNPISLLTPAGAQDQPERLEPAEAIFNKSTILLLVLAVMSIVTFRRNSEF